MLEVKPQWVLTQALLPQDLVPDHRVQGEEQLARGYHLPGFVPPAQTGVEVTDDGMVAGVTVAMQGIVHTETRPLPTAGDMSRITSYYSPWFAAIGKEPARYLYYKDVECDPPEALP